MDSDSDLAQGQDPADEETIAKAEEANRLAAEHGVSDPGGLPGPANAEGAAPTGQPSAPGASATHGGQKSMEEAADDVFEELGPPQ